MGGRIHQRVRDLVEPSFGGPARGRERKVILLQRFGPALRRPHSGVIAGSKHSHMKELIIQHAGRPYRVLYAFDPQRCALLLIGGDKTGDDRWYERFVPIADRLYDEHLAALEKEGSTDG